MGQQLSQGRGLRSGWTCVYLSFYLGAFPYELHLVSTVGVAALQVKIYKLKEPLPSVTHDVGIGKHSTLGLTLGCHHTVSICTLEERPQGG